MDNTLEKRRVEGIDVLGALLREPGDGLDRIVRLAARITGSPSAAIHIIDEDSQHRVAAVNAPLDQWPREDSMCRLVIEGGKGIAVEDAVADERFGYSTFISNEPPVRYYASAPLETELYGTIGTVCAWDTAAHSDVAADLETLADLAALVVERLRDSRLIRLLRDEARTDELTGLPNRRMVHDRVREAINRQMRGGDEVVVAFVDLNDFKPINDQHGHEAGDEVLVHVAKQLRGVTRTDEVVGRLGGDEFLILGTSGMHSPEALRRLQAGLSAPAETSAGTISVAASFGFATAEPDEDAMSLIRRADGAMFDVKRTSKTR